MKKIKLISDSSCDLTKDEVESLDVSIAPFTTTFDGVTYLKEGIDISIDEFYVNLQDESLHAKTSLPSVNDYIELFEEAVKNDFDILCLTISSGLSGSSGSARTARDIVLGDHKDAKIVIIDTLNATAGQAHFVKFANELINSGLSLEEIEQICLKNTHNSRSYVTVSSLKYLHKGGRVSAGSAIVGDILNVNPIIEFKDGVLTPIAKTRGRKKALQAVTDYALEFAKDKKISHVTIANVISNDDAEALVLKWKDLGYNDVDIRNVGVTISAHTGSTVVGVAVSCFEK